MRHNGGTIEGWCDHGGAGMVAQWFEPPESVGPAPESVALEPAYPVVSVDDLNTFAFNGNVNYASTFYDGDKFAGGFGTTQLHTIDYWALRARSSQLFNDNLYARGLIRRLITNEINTGLTPEAAPEQLILGMDEDQLNDWSEMTETRFGIWSKSPQVCDWKGVDTFGAIQRIARTEALVSGDVLVVLRQSRRTQLPSVQLVRGDSVQTPLMSDFKLRKGHTITHGVELDNHHKVVAYWIRQEDGKSKRLPAFGERSGRRIAWLVYGTDRRMGEVRGQPLLSLVLQSLKEIDRYRDSVQRKAVINSILAMFIQKDQDKMGTLPVQGGAVRADSVTTADADGSTRKFNIAQQIPGMVMEELQHGEKPIGFEAAGTDLKFGDFEEAIIQGVAWANEMPPEILRLTFSNNYSASQAAINEFKIYLNKVWGDWGETFCTPIYDAWLISETLLQNITAPGLLEAWRDPLQYDVFGAWTTVDWYGSIKPSTDMLKQTKGSQNLVANAWSTNAREARQLTGTKFSKNIKRLKREAEQLAEVRRPMLELEAEFGPQDQGSDGGAGSEVDPTEALASNIAQLVTDEIKEEA